MIVKYDGELEIDLNRGVIYFHLTEGPLAGVTLLRINDVPLEEDKMPAQLIDINAHPAVPATFDLAEFSRVNLARMNNGFKHELSDWSEAEWSNAIAGEFGEMLVRLGELLMLCNTTKKMLRYRDGVAGNVKDDDLDLERLRYRAAREVADVIIYSDLTIQKLGLDTAETVREVFNAKSIQLGCPIKYGE